MAPKISKTTKMQITGKKVGSWSLPAGTSCPGSSDAEVCKSCYAKKGMYRFPVVKDVRTHNRKDYHREEWVSEMVQEVKKFDYFRWFDSGDIETPELAAKIRKVINETRDTLHWLPTRSDKIDKISEVFDGAYVELVDGVKDKYSMMKWVSLGSFSNVSLRPSADNIGLNNEERPGVNSYVIRQEDIFEAKRLGISVCPVTTQPNKKSCGDCTLCYTNAKVAYVIH